MNTEPKKLNLSRNDHYLAGICGRPRSRLDVKSYRPLTIAGVILPQAFSTLQHAEVSVTIALERLLSIGIGLWWFSCKTF